MSDYQRIVSYLYEYNNGIKGGSAGFAKIERRQNHLRLYFHVTTNDDALTYRIYFYHFTQGKMQGILLDTIQRKDKVIEFKHTYPLSMDLSQQDGFLIFHSDHYFFGSEWNDKPIIIRHFMDEAQEKKESEKKDSKPPKDASKSLAEEPAKKPEKNQKEEHSRKKDESQTDALPEKTESSEVIKENHETTEEKLQATSKLVEYIEALQLEKQAKEQPSEKRDLHFDWKEYPSLSFPAAYGFDPVIKIQLKDLPGIHGLPVKTDSNGFLLLNYGNYGHLMLAWDPRHQRLVLGVPGIFDNEKNFIATLFGFQRFITVPKKTQKTGSFGYWILS